MVVNPDSNVTCPRCAFNQLKTPIEINALSRTKPNPGDEPVYVCSDCGVAEAIQEFVTIQDFANGYNGATPQKEWPVT